MNNQNWKKVIASLGFAAVVSVPALSIAADVDHAHKHGHGHGHSAQFMEQRFDKMAEQLALTEGQKAQIRADREANQGERMALRQQAHKLRKQIQVALREGVDQSALDGYAAELGALEIQKMQQRHESRQQFLAVLTDEQKAELETLKQKRMEKHQQRMQDRLEARKAQQMDS
ncbi:Spy/CpxP family protein refolding chaperone [Microbulbifer hainanensis]|uniref:Spy/CpxP family protein refolding chaperone n=1 Tax=Microbulbifer hainanensis TaxID=2735675 RepID=UPI0018660530|nr:Spy/CpxP family protein refolding chaperone [Microbulbifer hainanensis]